MEGEIAELRGQLAEAQRFREVVKRVKEAEQRAKDAERQVEPNSLPGLLKGCHKLSQALRVQTKVIWTQGDATTPVNRLFPKRILPWSEFPRLQEKIWDKLNRDRTFIRKRLFQNNNFLDQIHTYFRRHLIFSEESLRYFQRDTIERFVDDILDALVQDNTLSRERRNPRADQFCVHVAADQQRIPAYAVEFKAPHKLTIADLIAGLHEMELEQDAIDKDGDTFEFHARHLVAAVITQLFSYMVDSGVRNGYICTGEAYIFLHIADDPTVVYYYLCIPNKDVNPEDKYHLHRTAVAQVLAFTLNALAAEPPPQSWFDAARQNLSTWKVEYLNVLKDIPESVRKDPPSSEYKPSYWKPMERSPYHTRARGRCQPNQTTPQGSSGGSSTDEDDLPSPSPAPATRGRGSRGRGRGRGRGQRSNTRHYCTMVCLRGLCTRGRLDPKCPNVHEHGSGRHQINSSEFTRRLHAQLRGDRDKGFEQLHIRGRTGFLLKATLLSHGCTVIIKATTERKQHDLQKEVDIYSSLQQLQGYHIPVHIGSFHPRIPYWYHGERMSYMMILSWSGICMQTLILQSDKLREILLSRGIVHRDFEYRNMLWNESLGHAIMIDFEDVTWIKERQPLGSTSGNLTRRYASDKRSILHGNDPLPSGPRSPT
ncbi:hypothetical protein BDV37DRAFT_296485 [Aspergillus pseudonomiae]|uniref:Protein kinase domain-containing protein n=1 Tax=Aspergillus pseudonomiae TaxID=1506151 RepID=A0A5N7DS32_9EURO|nr:uncharacterized protein BDV37DRAFT_296485 [Aspergillus pseudonomiae]KAE8408328.1 hypothetical protein BDV37DRAFT_296485 [Aspergillus pseudonomiae]